MASAGIRLIGDRFSHPSRTCVLFARTAKIPHQEVTSSLLTGEYLKNKELPMRTVPVLKHGDLTISQSTTILRYLGQQPGVDAHWYPAALGERAKVDEFLDFWQSAMNPAVLRLAQMKLMYKLRFRLPEPDEKVVAAATKDHQKHKKLIKSYFIGDKAFIGGDQPSVADLLAVCTLEQTAVAGVDHSEESDYTSRVGAACQDFDLLHENVRNAVQTLTDLKML